MEAIGLSLIAYLLGSISFAVVCSKLGHIVDPRQSGSGNPGATNVLRLGGPKVAAVVLLGDAIKGLLPVVIGHLMGMGGLLLGLVGLAAFVGHCYPIWHGFKGGKGVATFLGVCFGFNVMVGILCCAVWLLTAILSRYASLASLLAAIASPILLAKFSDFGYVLPCCVMVAILYYRHWPNILRLKAGDENKINLGRGKKTAKPSHSDADETKTKSTTVEQEKTKRCE